MSDPIDPRAFGQVEGRLAAIEQQVQTMDEKVDRRLDDLNKSIKGLQATVDRAKGGGKAMQWIASGGAGAVLAWLAQHLPGMTGK